ncbi:hypothetical protein BC751_2391 [Cecembia calidifontis]|jgi:hypothetical protein|uniref:Uncharacterized protein n=1 Tax=Cecembia calidifontis TaxID=1187080 RepID=A0A4V2F6M1_9BACT|nr:hypothetical protein BC751_2391 [Cecembia calidifontis]
MLPINMDSLRLTILMYSLFMALNVAKGQHITEDLGSIVLKAQG